MGRPVFTRQFERDIKRMKKRGKDLGKIKVLIYKLTGEEIILERTGSHSDLFE